LDDIRRALPVGAAISEEIHVMGARLNQVIVGRQVPHEGW
jgi:hypothetical protein